MTMGETGDAVGDVDLHRTEHVVAVAGTERTVLAPDASAAAGVGDGVYDVGGLAVTVKDGVPTLAGGASLAGSTLTMDAAFRNAIECGLSVGAASRAASLNPARVIGLADEVGSIEPGKRANLLVLDEALSIVAVIEAGAVVEGAL